MRCEKQKKMTKKTIKIGTRGSALALWQANHVQSLLKQRIPSLQTETITILTSGDWKPEDGEKSLNANKGGKAQFAKEIEEKLLNGDIDIAVHSMKDMDSILPEGLEIPCILPREEEQDVLLFRDQENLLHNDPKHWPAGTTIGTSSVRRQAMLQNLNPQLNFIPLRGNVETRISKLRGDLAIDFPRLDATMLALSGLKRLQKNIEIDQILPNETMLPAAAQGAIGIEIASKNKDILTPILTKINCERTLIRISAERAVLATLDGSCHTPIGIFAKLGHNKKMSLYTHILSPDGKLSYKAHINGPVNCVSSAQNLGINLANKILQEASTDLLEASL